MDTILRSSKNKRISRYILRKEDLVEASSQAIYIDKTAFRGVLQTKDHPEVFYGENTCRILLWTEDFQRSSSDSRPSGDVLQHENFHSFSIDRTFARGLLQTPKRHSRGILLISERPSRDLLSSEDPPEDIFRQNSQRSSLDKSLLRSSVKRRSSRGLLLTAALLEAQPEDRPGIFLRQKKNLTEFFYRQKPFKGHLQRENLSEVFYRQQTFQRYSLDKIQSRGLLQTRAFQGPSIDSRASRVLLQTEELAETLCREKIFQKFFIGKGLLEVFSRLKNIQRSYLHRRPSRGHLQTEDLPDAFCKQRTVHGSSSTEKGKENISRRSSRFFQAKKTSRSFSRRRRLHQKDPQKVFQALKGSSQQSPMDEKSPRGILQAEDLRRVFVRKKIPVQGILGGEDLQKALKAEKTPRGSSKPKRPLKILKAQRTPRGLKGLPGVENFQKIFQLVKGSSQRSSIDKRSPRGILQIEHRLGVLLGLKIFQSFFVDRTPFKGLAELFYGQKIFQKSSKDRRGRLHTQYFPEVNRQETFPLIFKVRGPFVDLLHTE